MLPNALPVSSHSTSSPRPSMQAGDGDRGDAAVLVRHTRHNLEKISAAPGFRPLTAEQAADNILGFIARQLDRDKAAGATPEALESRLQAGLRGFQQGFAEAREKLEALSLLSPEVEASIGKTRDLVLTGIDELALTHLGHKLNDSTEDQVQLSPLAARGATLDGSAWQLDYSELQAQSFHFELMTREGDRVTISASRQEVQAFSAAAGQWRYDGASNSHFALSIEGELSAEEHAAIDGLLQQVDELAADFYGGDLEGAFASALSLGYDAQQISAFSLNLTRTEIQRASHAYGSQPEASPLQSKLAPLGQFVKKLEQALDTAGVFAQPADLLTQLAEQMVREPTQAGDKERPYTFSDFIEQLLANSKSA